MGTLISPERQVPGETSMSQLPLSSDPRMSKQGKGHRGKRFPSTRNRMCKGPEVRGSRHIHHW